MGSGRGEGLGASVGLWAYEKTVYQPGVGGGGWPTSGPDMKSEVSKQYLIFSFRHATPPPQFSFPVLC